MGNKIEDKQGVLNTPQELQIHHTRSLHTPISSCKIPRLPNRIPWIIITAHERFTPPHPSSQYSLKSHPSNRSQTQHSWEIHSYMEQLKNFTLPDSQCHTRSWALSKTSASYSIPPLKNIQFLCTYSDQVIANHTIRKDAFCLEEKPGQACCNRWSLQQLGVAKQLPNQRVHLAHKLTAIGHRVKRWSTVSIACRV